MPPMWRWIWGLGMLAVTALVFVFLAPPIHTCLGGPAPQPPPSCDAAFPAWHAALPVFDRLMYDFDPAFPALIAASIAALLILAIDLVLSLIITLGGRSRSSDVQQR